VDENEEQLLKFWSEIPILIIPEVKGIPPYTTWIPTPRNYVIHDDEEKRHFPYIDEATFDNDIQFVKELDTYCNSDEEHVDVGDEDIFYDTVTMLLAFEKRPRNDDDKMWHQMIKDTTVVRQPTPDSLC